MPCWCLELQFIHLHGSYRHFNDAEKSEKRKQNDVRSPGISCMNQMPLLSSSYPSSEVCFVFN